MVSKTALMFLASALAANGKLTGWPEDFGVVHFEIGNEHGTTWTWNEACEGWGQWCDPGKCTTLDSMVTTPATLLAYASRDWDWVNVRKPGAPWLDLWKVAGTDTYNMYEENGDGTVHGQCQKASDDYDICRDTREKNPKARPLLHCWQW